MDFFSSTAHTRTTLHRLALLFLLLSLLACERNTKDEVKKHLNNAIEELKTQSEDPLKEVEKLYQLEYTVRSFPLSTTSVEFESALRRLGEQRWDCFHVERTVQTSTEGDREVKLLVFCKRFPKTYLRYIPKNFIGR